MPGDGTTKELQGGPPAKDAVFHFTEGEELQVTPAMHASYEHNGYVLIKGLFSAREIAKLDHTISVTPDIAAYAQARVSDDEGRFNMMLLWNHPGDDILSAVARTRKVANTAQQLMGGEEIYHYHTKLNMKKGKEGGAFVWHQDYGYWYQNGCMFPDMSSVFIAIDPCDRKNGCLEVLRGSHRAGRIPHGTVGEQAGADITRVHHLATVCPLDVVEMQPGDAIFFNCNLLHCSSKNDSSNRRFVLIPAFNKRSNNPLWKHHHPQYTKLNMLPDDAVLTCERITSSTDKWFMDKKEDSSHVIKNGKH